MKTTVPTPRSSACLALGGHVAAWPMLSHCSSRIARIRRQEVLQMHEVGHSALWVKTLETPHTVQGSLPALEALSMRRFLSHPVDQLVTCAVPVGLNFCLAKTPPKKLTYNRDRSPNANYMSLHSKLRSIEAKPLQVVHPRQWAVDHLDIGTWWGDHSNGIHQGKPDGLLCTPYRLQTHC
ncbi:hypothetical protein BT67DRAFT_145593 [Trichocladium antarcticum]|uniref:Uncharacterized protein n=1 Tax=Trichocladium antarcticum TaxID=1450529 RepID=A0AAN6ZBB5_9PEZI|nr:hypothetical protein BT67DRAFT_145593 [Trichocladium antarcticum]